MKIIVDLTRQKFDDDNTIDFYDSKTIFFDATTFLPETVSFKVWGAETMNDFNWNNYIEVPNEANIESILKKTSKGRTTIQGFGTLNFNKVVSGKIVISPYIKNELLKDKKDRQIEYIREWTLENIDNECYEYWLDTNIYFPYGRCDLKLFAKGKVTFEFDSKDCVNYQDYLTNPNRQDTHWGYLKEKTLTTNSYKYEDLDNNR